MPVAPPPRPPTAPTTPTTTAAPGPRTEAPTRPNDGSRLVRTEGAETVSFAIPEAPFEARDGDVLIIAYPEVTVPLSIKYATVKIGGISYTRRMQAGDNVGETFAKVYGWIKSVAEGIGAEKVKRIAREFKGG